MATSGTSATAPKERTSPTPSSEPGGVITYWHVDDDVAATFERLESMGAKEYQPITPRGDQGFVTAAVIDPFGNVLGIMYNPHYLEMLQSSGRA
jgi:predicted enzyme related to lactoylglutathione lyase